MPERLWGLFPKLGVHPDRPTVHNTSNSRPQPFQSLIQFPRKMAQWWRGAGARYQRRVSTLPAVKMHGHLCRIFLQQHHAL